MNIVEAIKRVIAQHDLSVEDMVSVMTDIMTGNTTDAQNAAFLVGLQMKGIKVPEILGCLLYTSPSPRDHRGSRRP